MLSWECLFVCYGYVFSLATPMYPVNNFDSFVCKERCFKFNFIFARIRLFIQLVMPIWQLTKLFTDIAFVHTNSSSGIMSRTLITIMKSYIYKIFFTWHVFFYIMFICLKQNWKSYPPLSSYCEIRYGINKMLKDCFLDVEISICVNLYMHVHLKKSCITILWSYKWNDVACLNF